MNTKASFLSFLDSEVERLERIEKRPGWTRWAILAALGTSLWLASAELQTLHFAWDRFAYLLLVVFIAHKVLKDLNLLLSASRSEQNQPRIFTLQIVGYQLRRFGAIGIASYALLLKLTYDLTFLSPPFFRVLCLALLVWNILTNTLGVLISYSDFPIPNTARAGIRVSSLALSLVLDTLLVWYLWKSWLSLSFSPSIGELRIVGITVAIYWLLRFLIDATGPNTFLDILYRIRRELYLGQLSLDDARNQTDIALSGMSISYYFQPSVTDILTVAESAERTISLLHKELTEIQRILKGCITTKTIRHARQIALSAKQHSNESFSMISTLESKLNRMSFRERVVSFIAPTAAHELQVIKETLRPSIQKLRQKSTRLKKLITKVTNRIEAVLGEAESM